MKNQTLIIECINSGVYKVNTYIIACPATLRGAIIDPGGEDQKIIQIIADKKIDPKYIINTHGHHDHTGANTLLSCHYDIPVCMHTDDIIFFKKTLPPQKEEGIKNAYDVDIQLCHNDVLDIGDLKLKILHTPGHTPGSVCLHIDDCLFSGDTLFVGDAGRTDIPGGNLEALIKSIEKRILSLPLDTKIYPGHDYGETPFSTIAREIKDNIYITDFISADI